MSYDFEFPFLQGFDKLQIPVIENGVPVWEEKFPIEKIEKLKKTVGMNKFSAQMMLVPVDLSKGRFDVSKLQFYNDELKEEQRNRIVSFSIGDNKIVNCCCWWDPSYGSRNGDGSVISVVFIDSMGKYYLHDIAYLYHSDAKVEEVNSAVEQCQQVAEFLKLNFVPSVYVEGNGIGKFLPEFLRAELKKAGVKTRVIEKTSRVSKALRILDAFDVIISAGYLFVNEKIKNTPWISEFQEWGPDGKCPDDGLDSVAGALSSPSFSLPTSVYTYSRGVGKFSGRTFRIKSIFDL